MTGGASFADYDGDGDPDLFVANGYDTMDPKATGQDDRLYRNDGGTFVAIEGIPMVRDTAFSSGSSWGDYDNDGDLDAFVVTQRRRPDLLWRNDGGGRFTRVLDAPIATDSGSGFSAAWVDVDADGNLDLSVFNGGLGGLGKAFLYRNLGGGRFERVTDSPIERDSAAYAGGVWADYDDDGDQDLFIPTVYPFPGRRSYLWRNDGAWRFTRVAEDTLGSWPLETNGAAWGDHDNDGDMDLFVAGAFGLASMLWTNDGKGGWVRAAPSDLTLDGGGNWQNPTWGDFDNDGDLDLLIGKWGTPPTLYVNCGGGAFARAPHETVDRTIGFSGSVATADVDGDGDLDAYLANWADVHGPEQENALIRNDSPARSWLGVRVAGTRSNRAGIGARVTVRARVGGRELRQVREVSGGTSFRAQSDLVQHFGLGDAAAVDEIVVRWPSGQVDRCGALRARRTVVVTEGRGCSALERS
jgi:hypothetical protein